MMMLLNYSATNLNAVSQAIYFLRSCQKWFLKILHGNKTFDLFMLIIALPYLTIFFEI